MTQDCAGLGWAGLGWLGLTSSWWLCPAARCPVTAATKLIHSQNICGKIFAAAFSVIAVYCIHVGAWDQDMMVLGRGLPPHPGTAGGSVWIQHLLLQVLPPYKRHPRLPSLHIQCSRVCKKQLFSLWTGVQRKIGPLLIKLHGAWLKQFSGNGITIFHFTMQGSEKVNWRNNSKIFKSLEPSALITSQQQYCSESDKRATPCSRSQLTMQLYSSAHTAVATAEHMKDEGIIYRV